MTPQETRQQLYDTMVINKPVEVAAITDKILLHKARYISCAHLFSNPGLLWWFIAVIFQMECELDFNRYLGNGQLLDRKTTIVPIGRGPFDTWEDGVKDALNIQAANRITDWSMGNVLYWIEGYNGYGYEQYHNMNSPYLWAGSDKYLKGKYTSDGKFNPNAISNQTGVALLLKTLLNN